MARASGSVATQGRTLAPWQTLLIATGSGLVPLALKKFADKRAKDSEDE